MPTLYDVNQQAQISNFYKPVSDRFVKERPSYNFTRALVPPVKESMKTNKSPSRLRACLIISPNERSSHFTRTEIMFQRDRRIKYEQSFRSNGSPGKLIINPHKWENFVSIFPCSICKLTCRCCKFKLRDVWSDVSSLIRSRRYHFFFENSKSDSNSRVFESAKN